MAFVRRLSWPAAILSSLLVWSTGTAGQDTWCGKVYNGEHPQIGPRLVKLKASNAKIANVHCQGTAQIIPGGWLVAPEASSTPLLDVQFTPRHSIYIGNETTAEFIVDAELSYFNGAGHYTAAPGTSSVKRTAANDTLSFVISIGDGTVLVSGTVGINTTDNLFAFNISQQLTPRLESYPVSLTGTSAGGLGNYTATSELFYLPVKTQGSIVKVDRLFSSVLYSNNHTAGVFQPYFPYGYYGSYSGFFDQVGSPTAFANLGFNSLNPVTDFADGDMTYTIDEMDGLSTLLWQYDMRNSYQNLTSVAAQIPLVKDHPSLLTYYTADEPDGWGYTTASTTDAYNLLAELDKYHPNALVLNCQNFFFGDYTIGADIIMEDAYPVGINTTYTTRWNTPCNTTYGDCGCDNCVGGAANLRSVSARVDDFKKYARWLGGADLKRKPVWAVPQAFSSPDEYWSREPTPDETWAMDLLAFNHGAMGRLAWLYPPSDVLINASAALARVVTVEPVVGYLTGANAVLVLDAGRGEEGEVADDLDVAYWAVEGRGVLVSVVNPVNVSVAGPVRIQLPGDLDVSAIGSTPWGNVSWTLESGPVLVADRGVPGLATSYVILQ